MYPFTLSPPHFTICTPFHCIPNDCTVGTTVAYGMMLGDAEGLALGDIDGLLLGLILGDILGDKLGDMEALILGDVDGLMLGDNDGDMDAEAAILILLYYCIVGVAG